MLLMVIGLIMFDVFLAITVLLVQHIRRCNLISVAKAESVIRGRKSESLRSDAVQHLRHYGRHHGESIGKSVSMARKPGR